MSCPEIDTLIAFTQTPAEYPDLRSHAAECAKCRVDVNVLSLIVDPCPKEQALPPHLIDRVMDALPVGSPSSDAEGAPTRRFARGHHVLTFVMGALTAWLTGVLGGGAGNWIPVLVVALTAGAVATLAEARVLGR